MRFINKCYVIFREVVKNCVGWLSRFPSGEVSCVIFNSLTVSSLKKHLNIKICPLKESFCLKILSLSFEILNPLFKFSSYTLNSFLNSLLCCQELFCREEDKGFSLLNLCSKEWINKAYTFHLIPKKLNSYCYIHFCWENIHRVSPHPYLPS